MLFDDKTYQGLANEITYRKCQVRSRDEIIQAQADIIQQLRKELHQQKLDSARVILSLYNRLQTTQK